MTSKYKKYPEYKDSGITGIDQIPKSWDVVTIKHIVSTPITDGPHETPKFTDEGIPFISAEAVSSGKIDFNKKRGFISEETNNIYSKKYIPQKYDIYMIKSGATTGVTAIVETDRVFNIWSPLAVVRCKQGINPYFVLNYMRSYSFLESVKLNWSFGTQQNIGMGVIENLYITKPSTNETEKIANFLDYETSKIDSLIEKQERLIDLLKEKRQSVISHAVTKGLNPDAPMKDSSVEWLGEIPEHWYGSKLKYLTNQIIDGAHFTPTYVDEGIPFLRVTDIHNKVIDRENTKYIPKNEHEELIKRCNPQKGDLLLSKNGTIGITKVIDWDWDFSIFVSLCLIKFKRERLSPYFFRYIFQSSVIDEQLFHSSKKTSISNLHLDKINELVFAIPPMEEQSILITYLDGVSDKYGGLINRAMKQIILLKERRTSLISAAVTGKIDVRDWNRPE